MEAVTKAIEEHAIEVRVPDGYSVDAITGQIRRPTPKLRGKHNVKAAKRLRQAKRRAK